MRYQEETLYDKKQTAEKIKQLVNKFYNDITKFKHLGLPLHTISLIAYFNFVKDIPYRMDNSPIEVISRAFYIIKHRKLGMDCKKKTILMGCYAKKRNIPYRFIASSNKPSGNIHHIFPQFFLNHKWINMDATYDNYFPGRKKILTKAEIL